MSKRNGLGRTTWETPIVSATIIIGQKKGKDRANRIGFCAAKPAEMKREDIDQLVRCFRIDNARRCAGRAALMSMPHASDKAREAAARAATKKVTQRIYGASRIAQAGWYKGAPEDSNAYVFHHDDSVLGEKTVPEFRSAMKELAEDLTGALCQDSVIVTFDTPDERKTHFVSTSGKGTTSEDRARRAAAQRRKCRR